VLNPEVSIIISTAHTKSVAKNTWKLQSPFDSTTATLRLGSVLAELSVG